MKFVGLLDCVILLYTDLVLIPLERGFEPNNSLPLNYEQITGKTGVFNLGMETSLE